MLGHQLRSIRRASRRSKLVVIFITSLLVFSLIFSNLSLFVSAQSCTQHPPTNVLTCITITLHNSQTVATTSGFQQEVTINWAQFGSAVAYNVQNVVFYDDAGTQLYAWCQTNCYSTAVSSTVWVNLGSDTIPAGGTYDLNLGLYATSTNNFSPTGVWGESPYATTPLPLQSSGSCLTLAAVPYCSITLQANKNDLVIVLQANYLTDSVAPTDTLHSSWTQRAHEVETSAPYSGYFDEYYTTASASGGDAIDCNWANTNSQGSVTSTGICYALDVSNVQTTPFDPNTGVPAITMSSSATTTPSTTVSTSNTYDFVFGFASFYCGGPPTMTAGTGFTLVSSTPCSSNGRGSWVSGALEYEVTSSTLSSASVSGTLSSSNNNGMFADAVQIYAPATANIVQSSWCLESASGTSVEAGAATSGCSSGFSQVFSTGVTAGDMLVVGVIGTGANPTFNTPTDTLSSTWTSIISQSVGSGSTGAVLQAWYAPLTSSGTDTVTVSSSTSSVLTIFLQEVRGITASGLTFSTGTGSSGCCSVSSFSLQQYSMTLMFSPETGSGTWTATSSFNLFFTGSQNCCTTQGQYSTTATGASTMPTSLSTATGSWAELGVSFALSNPTANDNGVKVFSNYFRGDSASGWTTAGASGQASTAPTGSPFGTNALYALNSGGSYMYTAASGQTGNFVIEYYTYVIRLNDIGFLDSTSGAGQIARQGSGSGWYGIAAQQSWTSWSAPPDTGSWTNEWVLVAVNVIGGVATEYLTTTLNGDYGFPTTTLPNPSNSYTVANDGTTLGLLGDGGGSQDEYWNGIIVREAPPNGVMPSVSGISLTETISVSAFQTSNSGHSSTFTASIVSVTTAPIVKETLSSPSSSATTNIIHTANFTDCMEINATSYSTNNCPFTSVTTTISSTIDTTSSIVTTITTTVGATGTRTTVINDTTLSTTTFVSTTTYDSSGTNTTTTITISETSQLIAPNTFLGFPDYTPIFIFMIFVTILLYVLWRVRRRYGGTSGGIET